jgi:hypothetical protein
VCFVIPLTAALEWLCDWALLKECDTSLPNISHLVILQVKLEIRPSTIEGAGLGLFVARDGPRVKNGTFLTIYGDRTLPKQQVHGTEFAVSSTPCPCSRVM